MNKKIFSKNFKKKKVQQSLITQIKTKIQRQKLINCIKIIKKK